MTNVILKQWLEARQIFSDAQVYIRARTIVQWNQCRQCDAKMVGAVLTKRYCSLRCKKTWLKAHPLNLGSIRSCVECGKSFEAKGSNVHRVCSAACRKVRNARSVRTHHERRPYTEAAYRLRTKRKRLPSGNLVRFYRVNPDAPRHCESCGETRVLDVAHKPGHERFGRGRRNDNIVWPDQVWVLCPTCHALHDRMHYSPDELGLKI